MNFKQKLKKFFTSLVAISMVATTVVPATTMAAEMPIIPDEYTVTLSQTDGGMLTFEGTEGNTAQFEEGDEVNINITPDTGYEFSKISIAYTDDGEVAAEGNDEGVTSYSFEMPSADLTVYAEWKVAEVGYNIQDDGTSAVSEETVSEEKADSEETVLDEETVPEETIEFEDDMTLDVVLENYVLDNTDESFVDTGKDAVLVNGLPVKNTLIDGTLVESGDTLDSIMHGVEGSDWNQAAKVLGQIESLVAVYDVDENSDYYVASANTMMDDATVWDYAFALYDLEGNVVDGCYYDKSTGLAYIPKSLYLDEDGTYEVGIIQLQLMQVIGGDWQDADSEFLSSSMDVDDTEVSVYKNAEEIFSLETTTKVDAGLDEDSMVVSVNGVPTEDYVYDSATGEITIEKSSAAIQSLSVVSGDEEEIATLSSGISTYSDAGVLADDMEVSRPGTTIPVPWWVVEGTGFSGTVHSIVGRYNIDDANPEDHLYAYDKDVSGQLDDEDMNWLYNWILHSNGSLSEEKPYFIEKVNTMYFETEFYDYGSIAYDTTVLAHYGVNNKTKNGYIPTGDNAIVDFSTLDSLVLSCGHITDPENLEWIGTDYYGEGAPVFIRCVWMNDDSTQAVFAFLCGRNSGWSDEGWTQAGIGLLKYNIEVIEPGYLTLKKSIDDSYTIQDSSAYNLEGAEYTVYKDESLSNAVATLTTDAKGNTETVELKEGTYYVQETKAPSNMEKDKNVYTVKLTSSTTEEVPYVLNVVDEPVTTNVTLVKSSGNTSVASGNDCYSLIGAEFTLYTDSGCKTVAKDVNGKNAVLTVKDEAGTTNTLEMALGTYYVKETKVPTGYYWDSESGNSDGVRVYEVDLTKEYSSSNPCKITISDVPMNDPLGITIYKVDAETGEAVPQGDATLAGAEFTIKYYDGYYDEGTLPSDATRTWVVQTVKDTDGNYSAVLDDEHLVSGDKLYYSNNGSEILPLGTYTIQETSAPSGYIIEGEFEDSDGEIICKAGEVFLTQYVDNFSGEWLYGGNVYTQEEQVARGDIDIAKWDYELVQYDYDHADLPQGDATLEGATFEIINDSANSVLVPKNGTEYQPGEVVMTITTEWDSSREQYVATTGRDGALPCGHYIILETEAPTGYLNKGVIQREFDITYDGEVVDYTASDNSILNNPIRGGVEIAKWDYELVDYDYDHADLPQGDATLAGAVFEITNTSDRCVLVDGDGDGTYEHYEPGEVVMSITTEWDASYGQYVARTAADALPYGSYHIEEVSAPNGYLNEGIIERDFEIREDGVLVNMLASEDAIQNIPIRGGFELQKRDAQTALADPQGSASFEGIEVALVNESDYCVLVDVDGDGVISANEHFEQGEYIMSFWTDENGYIITDDHLLPYGSYRLYEVNIPGSDGYLYGSGDFVDSYPDYGDYETTHIDMLADANVVVDFEIRTEGKIVNLTGVDDDYGETEVVLTPTYDPTNSIYDTSENESYENMVSSGYAMEDLVKRGDLAFRKQDGEDQSTPDGPIEWKLTSETTGETHYFWSDDNGDFSTDSTWNAHTYKTNAGEDYTDGVWFYGYDTDISGDTVAEYGTSDVGLDEDHLEAVDNSLGALPYDTYILEELPGEYNEGMELVTTEVEIYRDMRVVDLGTIDNYPHDITTTATSAESGLHYLDADEHVVVSDAIEYEGLTAGNDYAFITMLYDLNTGDFVKIPTDDTEEPDDGETDETESADGSGDVEDVADETDDIMTVPTVAEAVESDYVYEITEFSPKHRDGSETVEFMFDATGLDGHTIVLFEYLYDANGNLVVAEEDINEEDQMLYFPLIGTELTTEDGSHASIAGDEITLIDTVMYEGLPTNKNVTMKGTLYDKETQEAVATAETTWFNTEADGVIEIEFTLDASGFAGGSVVAAEEAYENNILIGHHFDLDDEDQTVSFPSVGTTMINNWTGEHQATVFENHNIDFTDTVAYSGLDTNKQYVVIGYLMDPETEEVVIDANGLEVTSQSEVFRPESPDGTIEVHFDFFAFGLHDTYTVAFEYLYEVDDNNVGTLIAQHTDYDDAEQTVQLMKPTLWTDASITGTDSNQTDATDEVDITDMLDITDLIVGHTYYVYGKAVHEDGTPVLDATTGEPVELYNMFVADAEEMELDIMNFVFDATGLDGQAVIFEEYMYADEDRTILITEEEDLGAYEQTIFFNSVPVIETNLKDTETGTHEAAATNTVSLTDEIKYEGLTIGKTYTATGYLMNKETGEKLLDANGNEITASSEPFTPTTPSGSVEVTFTFDASGLSGTHAVAFEQLYDVEGNLIAVHEDIDDEDQTVLLTDLSIGTTLLDEYTGSHNAYISRNGETVVRLVDTVVYSGLTKGEEYTVSGVLMNKETGEKVVDADGEDITSFATFKADGESGSVEVVFEFDASALSGITVVAYEYLYNKDGDTPIASHEDLNDENQAVLLNGPIIGTNASESGTGSKTVLAGQVSITDTVDYAGLVEGETYTLVGYAVNPDTGEAIRDANGNIVTNTATFTADGTAGYADVIFAFDASNLAGQTIVFVEYLYYGQSTDNDDLIAWHFDLSDEAQSINISSPPTDIITTTDVPTEIITTPVETTTTTTETSSPTTKRTADLRYIWILVAVAGCAAVAVAVGSKRRTKVRK